jgi:hypothetical protein
MKVLYAAIALLAAIAFCSCGHHAAGVTQPMPEMQTVLMLNVADPSAPAPVVVDADLELGNLNPDDIVGASIDWGDGGGIVPLERASRKLFSGTHTYGENGVYYVRSWTAMRNGANRETDTSPNFLYIGPPIRDYIDPGSGETVQIYDGVVVVTFNDWERLSQLEGDIADDPAVAAFLTAESARSNAEWSSIAAIEVVLPEGMTVEEAVADWPAKYPDLIFGVDPVFLVPAEG